MRMCDDVAGIAAVRHCGGRVVTAAMDRMTFTHPVSWAARDREGHRERGLADLDGGGRAGGVRERPHAARSAHLHRLPHDGRPRRRRAARAGAAARSGDARRDRGGRARRSCAATPASQSGSGSTRSGLHLRARRLRKLMPLRELAVPDRVAHSQEAAALPPGPPPEPKRGEHVGRVPPTLQAHQPCSGRGATS